MHAKREDLKTLHTITKRSDFVKAAKKGRKWVSEGLVIQVIDNDLNQKRVGYTVSKRTDKSAVKRNRIKRRLRAAAAEILPAYAKESCDYVLIGRALTADRPYNRLCSDIKWCLGKMKCLQK